MDQVMSAAAVVTMFLMLPATGDLVTPDTYHGAWSGYNGRLLTRFIPTLATTKHLITVVTTLLLS